MEGHRRRRGRGGLVSCPNCRDFNEDTNKDTRVCRLRQYTENVQGHLPIRSLDRGSENEPRTEIALPSGGQTTLSVVFHPLTGRPAKAEVLLSPLQKSTQTLSEYSLHSSSTP